MNPDDDFSRGYFAGIAAGRGEVQAARLAMVDRCHEGLTRLQADAWAARTSLADAVEALSTVADDIARAHKSEAADTDGALQAVTAAQREILLAEARLAGARQLAEALGLVAKVTP